VAIEPTPGDFNAQIRRAARRGTVTSTPGNEFAEARERLEEAEASGDPAAIRQALDEANALMQRQRREAEPDFGAGARPSTPAEPDMNSMIRAAARGWVVRGQGVR
jgi:hypothetical protein